MNSLKKAFNYANSKLFYLLIFSVLPAAFCSACFPISKIINFVCRYNGTPVIGFKDIFAFSSHILDKWWWIPFAMFLFAVLSFCMLFGAIDRHMRIGHFTVSFKSFGSRANYNFVSVTQFALLVTVCFLLDQLLFTCFSAVAVKLWTGVRLTVALAVIACIAFVGLEFGVSLLVLWVPTMMHTGLKSGAAFGLSVKQLGRDYWSVAGSLTCVSAAGLVFFVLNGLLELRLGVLLDMVYYSFIVVYYIVVSFTLFFEKNGIERLDLKKTSIWEK